MNVWLGLSVCQYPESSKPEGYELIKEEDNQRGKTEGRNQITGSRGLVREAEYFFLEFRKNIWKYSGVVNREGKARETWRGLLCKLIWKVLETTFASNDAPLPQHPLLCFNMFSLSCFPVLFCLFLTFCLLWDLSEDLPLSQPLPSYLMGSGPLFL